MSQLSHYFVTSPEMCKSYGYGPNDYYHCVASVAARNKREAIIEAVKHPDMADWVTERRGDGQPPFSGLKAVEAKCPHGHCFCDMCRDYDCPECEAEAEKCAETEAAL